MRPMLVATMVATLSISLSGCIEFEEDRALKAAEAIVDPWQRYVAIRDMDAEMRENLSRKYYSALRDARLAALDARIAPAIDELCTTYDGWVDSRLTGIWDRECSTLPSMVLQRHLSAGEVHATNQALAKPTMEKAVALAKSDFQAAYVAEGVPRWVFPSQKLRREYEGLLKSGDLRSPAQR